MVLVIQKWIGDLTEKLIDINRYIPNGPVLVDGNDQELMCGLMTLIRVSTVSPFHFLYSLAYCAKVVVGLGRCELSSPVIIILAPAVNLILQPTCTVSYTFLMGNVIRFVRKVAESDLSATDICIALGKHLGL